MLKCKSIQDGYKHKYIEQYLFKIDSAREQAQTFQSSPENMLEMCIVHLVMATGILLLLWAVIGFLFYIYIMVYINDSLQGKHSQLNRREVRKAEQIRDSCAEKMVRNCFTAAMFGETSKQTIQLTPKRAKCPVIATHTHTHSFEHNQIGLETFIQSTGQTGHDFDRHSGAYIFSWQQCRPAALSMNDNCVARVKRKVKNINQLLLKFLAHCN